jgi:hypothetical protein
MSRNGGVDGVRGSGNVSGMTEETKVRLGLAELSIFILPNNKVRVRVS